MAGLYYGAYRKAVGNKELLTGELMNTALDRLGFTSQPFNVKDMKQYLALGIGTCFLLKKVSKIPKSSQKLKILIPPECRISENLTQMLPKVTIKRLFAIFGNPC